MIQQVSDQIAGKWIFGFARAQRESFGSIDVKGKGALNPNRIVWSGIAAPSSTWVADTLQILGLQGRRRLTSRRLSRRVSFSMQR